MRLRSIFSAVLAVLFVGHWNGTEAAKRRSPKLPGEAVTLKTQDGWTLAAQYYPSQPNHLTFILLHGSGGRKEDWNPLARALILRGYGFLALDLRGHGGSQNPPPGGEAHWWDFKITKDYNEWMNMSQDVDAAIDALEKRGAPESAIGLGGAEVGGSIALRSAAVHKQIPMVFMLSPGVRYRELVTVNIIRLYYGKRPLLMVVGQDDKSTVTTETAILYQLARSSVGEENVQLMTVEHEHGTKMLTANPGLIDRIIDWMGGPQMLTPQSSNPATPNPLQPANSPDSPAPAAE